MQASPPSPAVPARYPALDGLRGLAALMVVTHNLLLVQQPTGVVSHVLVSVFDRGWIGVQLFFVLSGFLITGILLDDRGTGLAHFFARRVLRIFPLYYALLLLVFVLLPAAGALPAHFPRDPSHELWYWLYLSNWESPYHPGAGPLPHVWSLAVEEQFYLLWPFVVGRRSPRTTFWICLAVACTGPISRELVLAWQSPPQAAYQFTVCRIDALALGGAAAALLRDPHWAAALVRGRGRWRVAALAVLALGAVTSHGYRIYGLAPQVLGYGSLALAFAMWILSIAGGEIAADSRWTRALRWAPLQRVGQVSYGLYVLHVPLHMLLGLPLLAALGYGHPYGTGLAATYMLAGTVLSYALALVVYRGFESRFLRLKQRFPRANAPAT